MAQRRRIAIIGLGMAVTPHARVWPICATGSRSPTPSAAALRAGARSLSASRSRSPTTSARSSATGRLDAVMILTPPDTHLEPGRALRRRRQAHPAGEAARAARPSVPRRWWRWLRARRQARRRVPAPLPRGLAGAPGAARAGRPRRARRGQRDLPLVAAAELLRRAGPRHARARRRRRPDHQAIHTLDLMLSLTGPVAEVAAVCGTTGLHRMETEDFAGAACASPTARWAPCSRPPPPTRASRSASS